MLISPATLLEGSEEVICCGKGAGYGRVLFETARKEAEKCIRYEIDPLKCWWIRRKAKKLALNVEIVRKNVVDADLSNADVVFAFLSPYLMKKLEPKLKEMKPGSIFVSYDHPFPDIEPNFHDFECDLFFYLVNEKQ